MSRKYIWIMIGLPVRGLPYPDAATARFIPIGCAPVRGTTPKAPVLVALLAAAAAGCGGDDGGGGSGSIEGCLEDAGLNVRSRDINSVDSELVAAGAEEQFVALDLDQQEYTYEVLVFGEA